MDSLGIIKRLFKEEHITFDEAMTLIGDIKTDEKMIYISTPFPSPNKPFTPFTTYDTTLNTIITNEYPINISIKSD